MKLTNALRNAFVRSVMDDTPSVDYAEQIREAALAAAVAEMPPKVAALWKDKATRDWVKITNISVDGCGGIYLPTSVDDRSAEKRAFSERICAAVAHLSAQAEAQRKARSDLRAKLYGAAYGFTTRKALAAAMPEFAKYLPADDAAANRSLPVVANVVADFVKAGWPKGKEGKK